MGFFDSFRQGFEDGSKSAAERQANSRYRTLAQQEAERYGELAAQSDSVLLGKLRGTFTSESDKELIGQILVSRGYRKHGSGESAVYRRDY